MHLPEGLFGITLLPHHPLLYPPPYDAVIPGAAAGSVCYAYLLDSSHSDDYCHSGATRCDFSKRGHQTVPAQHRFCHRDHTLDIWSFGRRTDYDIAVERVFLLHSHEQIRAPHRLCRHPECDVLYVRVEGVPKGERASSVTEEQDNRYSR